MDSGAGIPQPIQDEGINGNYHNNPLLRPKHGHNLAHLSMKRKRGHMVERQEGVQTALDVVVVSGGATVGDVLLGSLPSEPTTASLPGFGLLTLSSFIPATPTPASASSTFSAGPAATGSSSASSPSSTISATSGLTVFPSTAGQNGSTTSTTSSSSTSSVAYMIGMATSMNGTMTSTSISNSSSSTITSMSSTFTTFSTSTSSISSSSYTSSPSISPTSSSGAGGIIPGGVGGSAPTSASPSSTAAAGGSSNTNDKAGPIAGGVFGGVAAAAVLGLLLFLLIRWWRSNQTRGQRLLDGPGNDEDTRSVNTVPSQPAMTQQSQDPFNPPAAFFSRFRRGSAQTARTSSTTTGAGEERGFQRLGGRKLTNVLESGGDGYSEPSNLQVPPAAYAANRDSNLSMPSVYEAPDAGVQSFDHGADPAARQFQAAPSASSMAANHPQSNRVSSIYDAPSTGNPFATPNHPADRALAAFSTSPGSESSDGVRSPTPDINEVLTVHEGASRTPVITGGNSLEPPRPQRRPGHGPDGLGRSNPSWDGSRHSRFSEAI